MIVQVIDRVTCERDVTTPQVLAYVRKLVPGWEEVRGSSDHFCLFTEPVADDARALDVPLHDNFRDYPRRMAELCNTLVEYGFVKQPSEALRGMAAMAPEPR